MQTLPAFLLESLCELAALGLFAGAVAFVAIGFGG
jgi:hypothetical protein